MTWNQPYNNGSACVPQRTSPCVSNLMGPHDGPHHTSWNFYLEMINKIKTSLIRMRKHHSLLCKS
eukprot:12889320-Prorocentrum_lima.AAC.1